MIEALATDRSDKSLDVRRLPGRTVCDHDLLDTHVLDPLAQEIAVDRIPITDQESRRLVFGERLDDLFSCPLGRRVRSDVEVGDHAAMMAEDDEAEQYAERRCRYREEVNGDDVSNMIVEERTPRLRRRLAMPNHVLGHGRLGHVVAKIRRASVT